MVEEKNKKKKMTDRRRGKVEVKREEGRKEERVWFNI